VAENENIPEVPLLLPLPKRRHRSRNRASARRAGRSRWTSVVADKVVAVVAGVQRTS